MCATAIVVDCPPRVCFLCAREAVRRGEYEWTDGAPRPHALLILNLPYSAVLKALVNLAVCATWAVEADNASSGSEAPIEGQGKRVHVFAYPNAK